MAMLEKVDVRYYTMTIDDYRERIQVLTKKLAGLTDEKSQLAVTKEYSALTLALMWDVKLDGVEAVGIDWVAETIEIIDEALPFVHNMYKNKVIRHREELGQLMRKEEPIK